MGSMLESIIFKSITSGCAAPPRLNASNCWVSVAARSPA